MRRRSRWLLIAVVIVIAIVAAGYAAVARSVQQTVAPLSLPQHAAAPQGGLDGTWTVSRRSVAGFRLEQYVLGVSGDLAGRTDGVTGTVVVAKGELTGATIVIDLTSMTTGQPAFGQSLDTKNYPTATFVLSQPVSLPAGFVEGEVVHVKAAGALTMRGTSRPVTVAVSIRRDGSAVDAVGSIPIKFADWGIATPPGYGFIGSLADHGVAELLLVLEHE